MDVSAMHGHLEVVKWLHENRPEGCSTNAMDWAAKEGKLVRALPVYVRTSAPLWAVQNAPPTYDSLINSQLSPRI